MEQTQRHSATFIESASLDEMEYIRQSALASADFETLKALAAEARKRDGWDDTDASWAYLAEVIESDLDQTMNYYG